MPGGWPCPVPVYNRWLSVPGGIYIPNLLFQCLEMLFTELIHPVFTFLNVRIIILSRTHPCRQNLPARDASPRDFSSLQTKSPRQGCIASGFFIPPDKISPPGMHRPGIFHPSRQNLPARDASPRDFSSLQTEALEKYYFISCIYAEAKPYFFAFPSNSSMYLSKSDINNLSCITRYFSNSVSA